MTGIDSTSATAASVSGETKPYSRWQAFKIGIKAARGCGYLARSSEIVASSLSESTLRLIGPALLQSCLPSRKWELCPPQHTRPENAAAPPLWESKEAGNARGKDGRSRH